MTLLDSLIASSGQSPTPATRETLRREATRELARRDLIRFTRHTFPGYKVDPAHRLIARHLHAVERGETDRLMIFMPPQHGKSELTTVRFPAWHLGRHPDQPIMACSYAATLAEKHSRESRDVVESPFFAELFGAAAGHVVDRPVATRQDSRRVDSWDLANARGGMVVAGVGGAIAGYGAHVGLIDDPIQGWIQAQSPAVRKTVWGWYRGTFRPRIREGGAIVLIMTRWHTDDLAGKLLKQEPGRWVVLRIPALAETQAERDRIHHALGLAEGLPDPLGREPGAACCPSLFSREALHLLQVEVGPFVFSAEYQGYPRRPEGNRFKEGWFEVVDAIPPDVVEVRFWDLAATEDDPRAAYTVGLRMARHDVALAVPIGGTGYWRDYVSTWYLRDVVRGQWEAPERDRKMRETAEADGPEVLVRWEQEPGSAGKSLTSYLIRLLTGFGADGIPATGSKEVRAEPFAAQAGAGRVKLLRGLWVGDFLDEVLEWPQGTYKDQVDAAAGAFGVLVAGGSLVGA